MPKQPGLPASTKMRHDHHFVEQLAIRNTQAIGQRVPVNALAPNPRQPRQDFGHLENLVESIRQVGVLEPLLVRPMADGFQIVSGERRFRAALEVGLEELPCIVLDVDEAQVLTIALIENLQRQDLSPFEEAEGLRALVDTFGYTHEDVAGKIGKARTSVTETLSIGEIPLKLQLRLDEAGVHAKSILLEVARIDDPDEQAEIVERIVTAGLTRDDLRALRQAKAGTDAAEDPKARVGSAATPGRRITYRSGTGITLTLYLKSDEITMADIQSTLREAIEELESPPAS